MTEGWPQFSQCNLGMTPLMKTPLQRRTNSAALKASMWYLWGCRGPTENQSINQPCPPRSFTWLLWKIAAFCWAYYQCISHWAFAGFSNDVAADQILKKCSRGRGKTIEDWKWSKAAFISESLAVPISWLSLCPGTAVYIQSSGYVSPLPPKGRLDLYRSGYMCWEVWCILVVIGTQNKQRN